MIKKIKITNLAKPVEYVAKEVAEVTSFRNMLLSSTDWTQAFDTGMPTIMIFAWRVWRARVRFVDITPDNYSTILTELKMLQENVPNKDNYTSTLYEYPTNYINGVTRCDILKSCTWFLDDTETISFLKDTEGAMTIDEILKILDGYLISGY